MPQKQILGHLHRVLRTVSTDTHQAVGRGHRSHVADHEEELHSHLLVADHSLVVAADHIHQVVHIGLVVADHNHPAHCTYKTRSSAIAEKPRDAGL